METIKSFTSRNQKAITMSAFLLLAILFLALWIWQFKERVVDKDKDKEKKSTTYTASTVSLLCCLSLGFMGFGSAFLHSSDWYKRTAYY